MVGLETERNRLRRACAEAARAMRGCELHLGVNSEGRAKNYGRTSTRIKVGRVCWVCEEAAATGGVDLTLLRLRWRRGTRGLAQQAMGAAQAGTRDARSHARRIRMYLIRISTASSIQRGPAHAMTVMLDDLYCLQYQSVIE